MNTDKLKTDEKEERDPVTHDIIGAAFEVHRVLGYGFLEKVYQRAMQVELKLRGRDAGSNIAFRFNTKARVWANMSLTCWSKIGCSWS